MAKKKAPKKTKARIEYYPPGAKPTKFRAIPKK